DYLTKEIATVIRRIGGPAVLWRDNLESTREYWVWGETGDGEIGHTSYDAGDFVRNLDRLETEGLPSPVPALGYTLDGSPLDQRRIRVALDDLCREGLIRSKRSDGITRKAAFVR